jgi:hypothetical protein
VPCGLRVQRRGRHDHRVLPKQAEHRGLRVTPLIDQGDTVTFQPAGGGAPFGTVQVAPKDTHAEITIDLFTSTCLPLDFPKYPGAQFGGQNMEVGAGSRTCHIAFLTNDSIAAVTAFYDRALNTGSWQVTTSTPGQVGWRLRNGKATVASGTVAIAVSGERTEIKVDASP